MTAPARILRRHLRRDSAWTGPTATAAAAACIVYASPWTLDRRRERVARYISSGSVRKSPAQTPAAKFKQSSTIANNTAAVPAPSGRGDFFPEAWFTYHPRLQTVPPEEAEPDLPPPENRNVKLGKTLRILQDRLPTLLQSPLPQEVLSPHITLHLFPSTHPHLPTVTGRVAYIAALWSSPIAWNRVPLVGNVRLEILSARMVHRPATLSPGMSASAAAGGEGKLADKEEDEIVGPEQLIVKWRTVGGGKGLSGLLAGVTGFVQKKGSSGSRENRPSTDAEAKDQPAEQQSQNADPQSSSSSDPDPPTSSTSLSSSDYEYTGPDTPTSPKEFTGLFIFEFDREGRILHHTIEHMQQGGQWEKGVGAKVVGLTDWLLGGIKGGGTAGGGPVAPAFARVRCNSVGRWLFNRRR